MLSKRRAFERFDFFVVLEFKPLREQAGSFLGITRNFSSEGFSFESQDFNLGPGGTLECRFKHPASDLMVSVPGEIVWKDSVNKLQCLTGIKFREIGEDVKNKILEIMSAAGEVPADFCPGGKEAASYSNKLSDLQKVDQAPEGLAQESEDVQLKEPVHYDTPERFSKNKHSGPKKKIPLFIPIAAFMAGIALFIAFNESGRSFKSLFPSFIKELLYQETNVKEPASFDGDYQVKTADDRELSETLQSQTVQEEESLLTKQEKISAPDLNVEIVPIPEISKKQPLFFAEDLMKSNATRQKSVQSEQQQSDPETYRALAKEDLINDLLTKQKSIKKDHQRTVLVKDSSPVKEEKPGNIRRSLPEGKDIKEISDKNMRAAMVPGIITEKPPAVISEKVGKEVVRKLPGNLVEKATEADNNTVGSSGSLDAGDMTVESVPEKKLNDKKTATLPAVETPEKTENQLKRDLALVLKQGRVSQNAAPASPRGIKKEETVITENLTAALHRPREIEKKDTVILNEFFDDNTGKWDIFNTSAASAQIKGGEYIIENKRKTGKHYILHYHNFPDDSDFIIETDIRKARSIYYHAYGFVLGARDAFNNHVFLIIGNQFYLINKYHNGAKQNLTGGKLKAGIINKDSLNTLKIEKNGSSMRFYINDNYIDEVLNISFDGNKIGFVVEGNSKISVDKIHLQASSFQ